MYIYIYEKLDSKGPSINKILKYQFSLEIFLVVTSIPTKHSPQFIFIFLIFFVINILLVRLPFVSFTDVECYEWLL